MSWFIIAIIVLFFVACLYWAAIRKEENSSWKVSLVLSLCMFLASGLLYYRLGAYDELESYEALYQEGLTLGQIVTSKKLPKEQVFALQKHLTKQPKNHEAWHLLGQALVQLGEFKLANKAFERSLKLQPESFDILLVDYAESLYLANQGFTPKVHELLKEARRLSTENPKVDALFGFDAFHRKDYAAAKRHWQKAIQASPSHSRLAKTLKDALGHLDKLEKSEKS